MSAVDEWDEIETLQLQLHAGHTEGQCVERKDLCYWVRQPAAGWIAALNAAGTDEERRHLEKIGAVVEWYLENKIQHLSDLRQAMGAE